MMKTLKDIDASILPWLGRASKGIDYFIADCFQARGIKLTKVQMILLKRLVDNDGQPQHNLASITNRDKTSLARLLSTMEKKGMVRREMCEQDRRINHVFITPIGINVLNEAVPIIHEIIETIQKEISESELKTTIKVLKKLAKNIQPREESPELN